MISNATCRSRQRARSAPARLQPSHRLKPLPRERKHPAQNLSVAPVMPNHHLQPSPAMPFLELEDLLDRVEYFTVNVDVYGSGWMHGSTALREEGARLTTSLRLCTARLQRVLDHGSIPPLMVSRICMILNDAYEALSKVTACC